MLLPLAVTGLAALGGLVLVTVLQPAPALTTDQQAQRLAAELRCPDCQALSVAESHTAVGGRDPGRDRRAAGRRPLASTRSVSTSWTATGSGSCCSRPIR